MRVAIISSLFAPFGLGGAEQVAGQLAETLHQEGHSVDIISTCRRSDLQGRPYRVDTWNGIQVWRLAPRNLYWRYDKEAGRPGRFARAAWHAIDLWNPSVIRPLREILAKLKPDVINTHNIDGLSPLVWRIARPYTSATVHTLHDYHLACPRAIMQRHDGTSCAQLCGGCRVYASYHQSYQRYVDAVISPSRVVEDLHRTAGWTRPAMVVIRNAVDVGPNDTRGGSHTGPLQIVFMSRLVPEKGCEVLLRAIEHFRNEPNVQFHVAGEGPYAERFAKCASENSRLTWHGYVRGAEKTALLAGADVFLQLSEWRENAPLSLLEAKSFGNYVIGTDIGGIPELIEEPREGRLIRPADTQALVAAIEEQVANAAELRSMRASRVNQGQGYGVKEMARRYLDVFSSAVGFH